ITSLGPHQVEYFTLASLVERRLGQFQASIRDGEKAVELDPQSVSLAVSLAQTYSGLRRFLEAERVADAALERMGGAKPVGIMLVKNEAAIGMGNIEKARATLDSVDDKTQMDYQVARLSLYLFERDYPGAKAVAAQATQVAKKMPDFWLTLGAVAHIAGKLDEEKEANEEAKRLALAALGPRPNDSNALGQLAVAEAGLGQNEEALRHARQAVEILPPSVDAVLGPGCGMRLAQVLVMTRNRDGAFDELRKVVKWPFSGINYGELKFSPMWDDLRQDPSFERVLTESALPLLSDTEVSSAAH
ncbi:MAG TPA: tetratricopeptide repeat protein, partial [Chthoniobacterales bacterium]|nr:tetratricopeptide repeat protein [Chthoniobacterales bacterium]